MAKKCGELWRDEVDEETKAKYKTLFEDCLERKPRFHAKVASKSPVDVESIKVDVEKVEDRNSRFKEDVDEKVIYRLELSVLLPFNRSSALSILKLRFPSTHSLVSSTR